MAKLVVQTSRQSGAAAVYTELFDYEGDEFYFFEDHGLAGSTYAEAQLAFEAASVVGVIDNGVSKLNVPSDTVLTAEQTLIVVVEDDSALEGQSRSLTEPALNRLGEQLGNDVHPTQALLIGWNDRAPIVLRELERYAPPGSTLTVLTAFGEPVVPPTTNLAVTVVNASSTSRAVLDQHVNGALDQIIVLCYDGHLETQVADSRTLVTLLHVRDILRKVGSETPVVSEMMDDRNRVLASVADVDDIVVSGEIVSLLVTQLSEDGRLESVFKELLGAEGSEIYLRPAGWYVQPGDDVELGDGRRRRRPAQRDRDRPQVRAARRAGAEVRRGGEPAEVADLHDLGRRRRGGAGRGLRTSAGGPALELLRPWGPCR